MNQTSGVNEVGKYSASDLAKIKAAWYAAFEKAKDAKSDFTASAKEVRKYYAERHNDVYKGYNAKGFWQGATIPKTYEGVKVFGSFLHQNAPIRRVEGKSFNDPLAEVMEAYLKYTSRELDLRRHGRISLDEALITGKGLLFTEIDAYTGLVYSRHESVDNQLIDPDTTNIEDTWWRAYMCKEPKWKFMRKYGEAAKGVVAEEDISSGSDDNAFSDNEKEDFRGTTQNLVTYWKVYSKMGVGYRMKSAGGKDEASNEQAIDDYKMIILAPGIDKPVFIGEWPTPYWADTRSMGWPGSELMFSREPNKPWPISPFKPALPLQKWIDWAYSFMLRKVATTSRDVVVMPKRLDEEQKAVVLNEAMQDLEALYVDDTNMEDIRKVFATLQFPAMNGDLLTAIQMAEQKFREVTGLHEILSGITEASYRSAEEARVKDRNSRSRVEDMNQEIEVWHSHAARKEAIALRYHFGHDPEYIYKILGEEAAMKWAEVGQAGTSMRAVMREYEYNIEEGSMRRQTPQVRAEYSQEMMDLLFGAMLQTGSYDACNNIISEWCKARAIQNPDRFFVGTTVVDGQQVTNEQNRQMMMEQEQAQMQEQQQAEQQMQAEQAGSNANEVQMQMVQQKAQADLAKQAMQNQSNEKIAEANLLEKMLGSANAGGM